MSTEQPNATKPDPRPRRMARPAEPVVADAATKQPSKLDRIEEMLVAPGGASIAELIAATGWQQHSVRGAIAGALKKRGLTITSTKVEGVRRYCADKAA